MNISRNIEKLIHKHNANTTKSGILFEKHLRNNIMATTNDYLSVSFPASLAWALKMKEKEFENEMKTLSIVKLFELGKISSGNASSLLNINKIDFVEILARYQISCIQTKEDELIEDFKNA